MYRRGCHATYGFVVTFLCVVATIRDAKAQDLYSGGGTVYVPYSGTGAGFMPYTPGPGGGLGVQSVPVRPMARSAGGVSERAMGRTGDASMNSGLGGLRLTLTPLTPIRSGGGGMGMGGSLLRREASRGAMAESLRPPVGGYPFRLPGSSASPGGGMGMQ